MTLSARTAGVLGIAALLLACSDPDKAELSPFFLWGMRPGMQLDSVEQFLIRQDNVPWGKCEDLGNRFRRCERHTSWIWGRLEAVAGPDGRVLYLSFAPDKSEHGTGRDVIFDKQLDVMAQQWARTRHVRMDPHGVNEASHRGIAEFSTARGRWKALLTFDGRLCTGTSRPCLALIQLLDWRAAQSYALMTVPPL
ncbi:MAG: hypothetical protein DMD40_12665 [Gemmatimonadetes bacterium]|nr:MAG: hypothetical protein DMD40_12665 [Gemmatimonadota bacterium]